MKENMRFKVLVLLSTISCCCAPYPDQRRYSDTDFYRDVGLNYDRRRPFPLPRPRPRPTTPPNPGTTPENRDLGEEDERLADDIGVRIPPDNCITSWTDFKQFVINKEWIGIYGVDDDAEINPGVAYKFSVRWTNPNDTLIRREGSLWETEAKRCLFADGLFRRLRISDSLAIFGSVGGNLFATSNRQDYFVCSKQRPMRFCFFFICYDTQNNRGGRCRNSEMVLVVREQRTEGPNGEGIREQPIRLDDLPWTEIEYLFRECFGQQFDDDRDPQAFWAWKNPSCPVPGTPAFDRGVASG